MSIFRRAAAPQAAAPAAPATPAARLRTGRLGPPPWLAVGFLLPTLILLGAWVLYPIVYSVIRSLFDASGTRFIGGQNYADLVRDHQTLISIRNTAIWVVVAPLLVTFLGLVFAVLTERIRWATAFKTIIFMPMAISFLASGVIFRLVYEQDPHKGVANAILVAVHDTFAKSSQYPNARPRENAQSPLTRQRGDLVTRQAYAPGQVALLPLVGEKESTLPGRARPARVPAAAAGTLGGTVWLDFSRGGGGAPNQVDPGEKGMPGVRVQAVRDGKVAATTTTRDDGTFAFTGLAPASYTLRLPAANFAPPYQGMSWLGPTLITPAIIVAYLWVWAGFGMVVIAAGLAAIPREALEAARVDGATEWQVFRRVTMPLLSPVLLVVFVTQIINVLKVFDLVFIIAPGSVQPQADVVALEMWRVSFGGGQDQGMGSALAVFLFALVIPAMIFNVRRFRQEQ